MYVRDSFLTFLSFFPPDDPNPPYIGSSCALYSTFRSAPGLGVKTLTRASSLGLVSHRILIHRIIPAFLPRLDASRAGTVRVASCPLPEGSFIWVSILRGRPTVCLISNCVPLVFAAELFVFFFLCTHFYPDFLFFLTSSSLVLILNRRRHR